MPRFLDGIDLNRTELQNARIHNLAGAPVDPAEGQIYYSTVTKLPYCFNVDAWIPMHGANYRGAFDDEVLYVLGDFVTYEGSTYIVYDSPETVGLIPTDTDYWDLLSEGGVSTYTNAIAMPQSLGGLTAGQTFAGMSVTEIFDRLLYPYQNPGFSSFTMTGSTSPVEAGTTVSGSKTFTWSTSNASNVVPGSVQISQGATVIASGLNASGNTAVTIPTVTNNSPASQTWTIRGTNTNSTFFTATVTITWQYRKFYGTSVEETLDSSDILALTSSALGSSGSGSYSFVAGNYKYFVIPSAFTAPASIKDAATLFPIDLVDTGGTNGNAAYSDVANGLPFATVSVTNVNGVVANYRVYRSRYELGGSMSWVVA